MDVTQLPKIAATIRLPRHRDVAPGRHAAPGLVAVVRRYPVAAYWSVLRIDPRQPADPLATASS